MLLRMAVGLAFIVVPVLELMLLIRIGQGIGVLPTVALVLGTAATGAYVISRQSLTVGTEPERAPPSAARPGEGPIIEGEFERVDERPASHRNGPRRDDGRPAPRA
jgi:UPF0716 family protein affecting phage T7 exclusion